ncbi:MAG: hypothetical protein ACJARU_000588 [Congregibacter sp.]|jgi:hypothetical protein
MSEYELASLALERDVGLYALIALLQTQANLMGSTATLTFTLLFGYLVVAHLAATELSRVQVTILNTLYLAAMTIQALGLVTAHAGGIGLHGRIQLLTPVSQRTYEPFWSNSVQVAFLTFMAFIVAASLWFMWSYRSSKDQ